MMIKTSAFLAFAMVSSFCLTPSDAEAMTVRGRRCVRHNVRHHRVDVRRDRISPVRPVVRAATATARVVAPVVAAPSRTWVPGHYKTVTDKKVVVPGHYEKQYVEPQYETVVSADGSAHQVLVEPGHYTKVWIPAKTETVTRKVWVPGHHAS